MKYQEIYTCKHCGNTLMWSKDYEEPMLEHTETGSIYCWDDSAVVGEIETLHDILEDVVPMLHCNTRPTKPNV